MARPAISNHNHKLNDHVTLSECHPDHGCRTINWWLYDERAGMNLAMRAPSREAALLEALEYWAERAQRFETAYNTLNKHVQNFVDVLPQDEG